MSPRKTPLQIVLLILLMAFMTACDDGTEDALNNEPPDEVQEDPHQTCIPLDELSNLDDETSASVIDYVTRADEILKQGLSPEDYAYYHLLPWHEIEVEDMLRDPVVIEAMLLFENDPLLDRLQDLIHPLI